MKCNAFWLRAECSDSVRASLKLVSSKACEAVIPTVLGFDSTTNSNYFYQRFLFVKRAIYWQFGSGGRENDSARDRECRHTWAYRQCPCSHRHQHGVAVSGFAYHQCAGQPQFGADGVAGAFHFSPIDITSYSGASSFDGDAGDGIIRFQGGANPASSFSAGFLFAVTLFVPFTLGSGVNADITGGELSFTDLEWGGNLLGGVLDYDFTQPDPATLQVNRVVQQTATRFDVSFMWEHFWTEDDCLRVGDTSSNCFGFTARW